MRISLNRKNWMLWAILLVPAVLLPIGRWHSQSSGTAPGTGAITSEGLMFHIRYLASDELEGRLAGSPGAEKAAQYIAEQFARRNLLPLGEGGSYLQEFSFVAGVRLGPRQCLGGVLGERRLVESIGWGERSGAGRRLYTRVLLDGRSV